MIEPLVPIAVLAAILSALVGFAIGRANAFASPHCGFRRITTRGRNAER
ncbi:hypothetical protein [Rhodovulum sp. PH10]|nr:hypothetical protein [Rhodovulum sp. PH10]